MSSYQLRQMMKRTSPEVEQNILLNCQKSFDEVLSLTKDTAVAMCRGVICGRDLHTLRPGKFVNDEMVVAGLDITVLNSGNSNAIVVPALGQKLEKKGCDVNGQLKLFGQSIKKQIGDCNTIIFPISRFLHWTVVVFDRDSGNLYHYNPKSNADPDFHPLVILGRMVTFLGQLYQPIKNVQLVCVKDIPNQTNDFDCGLLVIEIVKHVLSNSFLDVQFDLKSSTVYRKELWDLISRFVSVGTASSFVLGAAEIGQDVVAGLEVEGDGDEESDNEGDGQGVINIAGAEGEVVVAIDEVVDTEIHSLHFDESVDLLQTGETRPFLGHNSNHELYTYNNPERKLIKMLSFTEAALSFSCPNFVFKDCKEALFAHLRSNPSIAQCWMDNYIKEETENTIYTFKFDRRDNTTKVRQIAATAPPADI